MNRFVANRYVDIWRKNKDGICKLWVCMDNQDIDDPFWPEQIPSGGQVHRKFVQLFAKALSSRSGHGQDEVRALDGQTLQPATTWG